MKTYEKKSASKNEVTPEHRLEALGSSLALNVGGTANMSNYAKNFRTFFIRQLFLSIICYDLILTIIILL